MLHIRMIGTLGSGHLVQNSHEWLQEAERNHEQLRTLQTLRTRHNEKQWQKAESRTNKQTKGLHPLLWVPPDGIEGDSRGITPTCERSLAHRRRSLYEQYHRDDGRSKWLRTISVVY